MLLRNVEKDKEIIKIIEKTRDERNDVDLIEEKKQRDDEERARRKLILVEEKRKAKEEESQRAQEKELKSYTALQHLEKSSNENASKTMTVEEAREIEEDFM